MNWYFCLSAASLGSRDHDWCALTRAAVRTARANTTLRPHLLWDGSEHPFLAELRAAGVKVIFRRVPFYDDLAHATTDPNWLAISAGAFLRVEIPLVEPGDAPVLYTDADVMFLHDPVPALRQAQPRHLAACIEFRPGEGDPGLNSGVMLLNTAQLRADYPAFIAYIRANHGPGLDQDMYRRFYAGKWELMPPEFNWRPYWGENRLAHILHWHGIKPAVVRRLLSDPTATTVPALQRLVETNPEGYRHYMTIYDEVSAPLEAAASSRPALAAVPAVPAGLRLGIAITTYNRRGIVLALVEKLQALTLTPFELVVCDDGSTDGTAQALRERGVKVITGPNSGIAWNKNRGLYYLLHVVPCEVILLLDDDVEPMAPGWEKDWIAAAWRYGHVNQAQPLFRQDLEAGAMTAADPGLTTKIGGWALAFTRPVLAQIGYLDPRFRRYGHEHSELTQRAVKAGFGGVIISSPSGERMLFYVIDGGLQGVPTISHGTEADIAENTKLFETMGGEPVYRHAWRDDAGMARFLDEVMAAAPSTTRALLRRDNKYASLAAYLGGGVPAAASPAAPPVPKPAAAPAPQAAVPRKGLLSAGKPATQSSVSQWSQYPTPEADAAGAVNGIIDGIRKFHTDIEHNPWWQVDLGGLATIREIHIHNTSDHTRVRFKDFVITVSIDGVIFVEVARKQDGIPVTAPYVWCGPGTAWARYVRITLLGFEHLHLDQVEVYGDMP